jgi:hypothetical protein
LAVNQLTELFRLKELDLGDFDMSVWTKLPSLPIQGFKVNTVSRKVFIKRENLRAMIRGFNPPILWMNHSREEEVCHFIRSPYSK